MKFQKHKEAEVELQLRQIGEHLHLAHMRLKAAKDADRPTKSIEGEVRYWERMLWHVKHRMHPFNGATRVKDDGRGKSSFVACKKALERNQEKTPKKGKAKKP